MIQKLHVRDRWFYALLGVGLGSAIAIGASVTGISMKAGLANSDSEDLAEEIQQSASPEQRVLIADGVVAFDEMEAAMGATAACIEASGAHVGVVVRRNAGQGTGGVTTLSWRMSDGSVSAELDAQMIGCYRRHSSAANWLWQEQNRPSASQLEALQEAHDACYVSKGHPEMAAMSPYDIQMKYAQGESLTPQMLAYIECWEELEG